MLAEALNLKSRHQANKRCRQLAKEGFVVRRVVNGKIHNFWVDGKQIEFRPPVSIVKPTPPKNPSRDWFWEGNVQAIVIRYLVSQKSLIRYAANTATREQGKDIIAERDGKQLWISVKGYPKGIDKTKPSTQAGHWFKQAIFDMIQYRGESDNLALGIALPDYPCYRSLASKITWFQPVAKFVYFWVKETGEVVEFGGES